MPSSLVSVMEEDVRQGRVEDCHSIEVAKPAAAHLILWIGQHVKMV